jgi:hypothetical protein
MEGTGAGGHVVRGTCVQVPFRSTGRRSGDAGSVEVRVQRLSVPEGGVGRRRQRLLLMEGRHRLLGLERWPWAEDAGARGPYRHRPGLYQPGPRVISLGPRDGGGGGAKLCAAAAGVRGGGAAGAPALLLRLGAVPAGSA